MRSPTTTTVTFFRTVPAFTSTSDPHWITVVFFGASTCLFAGACAHTAPHAATTAAPINTVLFIPDSPTKYLLGAPVPPEVGGPGDFPTPTKAAQLIPPFSRLQVFGWRRPL